MKQFITAVTANEDESAEGWIDFEVAETDAKGEVQRTVGCRARRPSPGQVAYLTASIHKRAPLDRQIAGAINFCMAIMDEPTAAYLSDRLLDSEDPFELPEIQDIIEYLIEEWSGRPTQQSPGSAPQAATTGSTSTESGPTSISSAFV